MRVNSLLMGVLLLVSMIIDANASAAKGKWIKPDTKAQKIYDEMASKLGGGWMMSPEKAQTNTTGGHKSVAYLIGKDKDATSYVIIGKGTTLQENLLTGTQKEMVTMYHCDRRATCKTLLATHYCAKRNQPSLILNKKLTKKNTFVFDCDMSTSLCQSKEDHIHRIILELSNGGKHLKSSYLGMKNQKWNEKNTIVHFDKRHDFVPNTPHKKK